MTLHQALNWLGDSKGPSSLGDATPTFLVVGIVALLALLLFRHEGGPVAGKLFARFNRGCLAASIACYGIIIGVAAFSVIKAA